MPKMKLAVEALRKAGGLYIDEATKRALDEAMKEGVEKAKEEVHRLVEKA